MTFSSLAPDELEARPERLLQAARDLANETGGAAFTVAQVTAKAGLSLKSFYQCFKGKDELLIALIAADSRRGAGVLATRLGDRKGAHGLHAFITQMFEFVSIPEARGYASVLVREYLRLNEHYGEEQFAAIAPVLDVLAGCLETEQPQRDALTIFAVLLGGIYEVLVGNVADSSSHAEYLYNFCAHGVVRS
jgi:AcrR family transcriptional regulator